MEQTNDLNIIYYGPPGTGKTYVTAQRAVEIVDGEVPDDRSELMKRYKELREKEQIDFVTFHQSYSYEEFVEGIRPVLVDEDAEAGTAGNENSMVRYECRPGIFRRICERAEVVGKKTVTTFELDPTKTKVWKMSLGSTQSSEEEWVYDDAIENQRILLGWGEAIDFAGCDTLDAVSERYLGSADAPPKEFAIRAVDRFKNKIANGDLVVVSDGNTKFRAIGRVTGEYYYTGKDDYAQARSVEWLLIFDESQSSDLILKKIFSQATVYELKPKVLKLEGLRDVLSSETPSDPRRYVLIIDEINRGNIAKILGELITLLEPDKRIGAPNELRAELPYSGSSFGVPANLHVIGTMNTADRSIALLDTALRRRFRFIEKMPDPAIVADLVGEAGIVDGVDVGKLLTAINQRIELLYDRDHTLGHAYLLSVESLADLRRIFLERVIPLLQEYFYDDWAKISLVLGCPFHEAKTKNPAPLLVAEELSVEKILGDVDGYETEARFQVNPSFVSAEASGLRQFFNEVIRTGQR